MSARKSVDVWVCDRCRAGLSVDQLLRLIRRDSSVALWNWRHKKIELSVRASASERTSAPNVRILAP